LDARYSSKGRDRPHLARGDHRSGRSRIYGAAAALQCRHARSSEVALRVSMRVGYRPRGRPAWMKLLIRTRCHCEQSEAISGRRAPPRSRLFRRLRLLAMTPCLAYFLVSPPSVLPTRGLSNHRSRKGCHCERSEAILGRRAPPVEIASSVTAGAREAGAEVSLWQVPELVPGEILAYADVLRRHGRPDAKLPRPNRRIVGKRCAGWQGR
jgi:hypothetical protein